jgi:3',5'-cyclic AMP phosphodiesterase CpdA
MRKRKLAAAAILAAALIIFTAWYINFHDLARSPSPEDESRPLTFSVVSDVHAESGKLKAAIIDLYFINTETDAMFLNGDVVDQGTPDQYDRIKKVLDDTRGMLPGIVIQNIGNHEYFNYKKGRNTLADALNYRKLYFQYAGYLSVYHDTWIKGYHFISLGSENANLKDGFNPPSAADLSENQLSWLKDKLKENREPGKPIFVFLHQHLKTSIAGWKGVVQDKELTEILSEYPEVILFTSHTHASLAKDGVIQLEPFTIVNTGAIAFINEPADNSLKRVYKESQGLYVEVEGSKVTVNGRDFAKNEWIFSQEILK